MFDKLATQLLTAQNECTLSWVTQDGSPAATVVSFFYEQNSIWMTAITDSPRVRAIRRDPRVAVVVSGTGSKVGHTRCVSMRGNCEVLDDKKIKDWFFPKFSKAVLHKSRIGAKMMAGSMNNADNIVIKFTPEKVKSYDAQKMMNMANFMP